MLSIGSQWRWRIDVVDEQVGTFQEFYTQYAGSFWEEHVPFELLDIADEENNIE